LVYKQKIIIFLEAGKSKIKMLWFSVSVKDLSLADSTFPLHPHMIQKKEYLFVAALIKALITS
jgi:hypothetical protein